LPRRRRGAEKFVSVNTGVGYHGGTEEFFEIEHGDYLPRVLGGAENGSDNTFLQHLGQAVGV